MSEWPPVLVMAAVAKLFGLRSEEAARKLVDRHGIPRAKLGRTTVVLTDSLISFLKARETVNSQQDGRCSAAGPGENLRAAAAIMRRRTRVDLREAAHRLAGKVAENPRD